MFITHNGSVLKRNEIGNYIDTNLVKYINKNPSLSINTNHQILIEIDYLKDSYNLYIICF